MAIPENTDPDANAMIASFGFPNDNMINGTLLDVGMKSNERAHSETPFKSSDSEREPHDILAL